MKSRGRTQAQKALNSKLDWSTETDQNNKRIKIKLKQDKIQVTLFKRPDTSLDIQ